MTPAALHGCPPHRLAERIVALAGGLAGRPAALYLVDLDGGCLVRVAGAGFPATLPSAGCIGPEFPPSAFAGLDRLVGEHVPGHAGVPMCVRGRGVAVLVGPREGVSALTRMADEAARAIELAGGYTDRFAAARRTRPISTAAEMQQGLLPPRLAWFRDVEVAATILPTYEVGGDWFEHADDRDGLWLAVADGVGKGVYATALSGVALGALRAARRNGAGLPGAALAMHRAVGVMSARSDFVTALIARFVPATGVLSWLSAGHPRPLRVDAGGRVEELRARSQKPLGLFGPDRAFAIATDRLAPGDRVVLYSDGVTERRCPDGSLLGPDALAATLAGAGASAEETVRAVVGLVQSASTEALRDDATVLTLTVGGGAPGGRRAPGRTP